MAITVLTDENFDAEVLSSEKPCLVDFWAGWCGPCRMLAPTIEEIAREREDVKVCKADVDACPGLASRFGIMSIPTVILFENGAPAGKSVGVRSKQELLALLQK